MKSSIQSQAQFQIDMTVAIISPIQNESNDRFWKVFASPLQVWWAQLANLAWILATGNLHPDSVSLPGGFQYGARIHKKVPISLVMTASIVRGGGGGTLGHKGSYQVNKKNTAPIPKLQMVPMLKLILEMDMS